MTRRKPATAEVHPLREESPDDAVMRAAESVLANDPVVAAAQQVLEDYERAGAESAHVMDAMLAEHYAAVEAFSARMDAMLKGDK